MCPVAKTARGFSLLEVVVVLAILAVAIPTFWQVANNSYGHYAKTHMRGDLEKMRMYLRLNLDCQASLVATPSCVPNAPIALYGKTGVILTAPATKKFAIRFRARCPASGDLKSDIPISYREKSKWKRLFKYPLGCL
jgi:prepilin-type N-terminal cleavage/methylation domain-containing protein